MTYIKILTMTAFIVLFSACSSKITVRTLEASSFNDTAVKKISVERFKNDSISLKSIIQSKMQRIEFDGKRYFIIVNRENISTILKEQKLQDSGLVNIDADKEFGLEDVNSIMTGAITSKTHDKKLFYEKRTNYKRCLKYSSNKKGKKRCVKYYKYKVRCVKETFYIRANINITKVSNARNIFSKNYEKNYNKSSCYDKPVTILDHNKIYLDIANKIGNEFVQSITPTYKDIEVEAIDDYDIEYNSNNKKLLKNALSLIRNKKYTSANKVLRRLIGTTKEKSSTALYNYGLSFELLGDLNNASLFYNKASEINIGQDINDLIQLANIRIKKSLKNKERATNQINN